jgi:hypothetical protein
VDLLRTIDAYCERLQPGLLAEPLNALTNAAFLIAAIALARAQRASTPLPVLLRTQPWLIAAIGLGSLAFHTFAVVWAALLDVGFIALYIYVALAGFLAHALGWRAWWVLLGLAAYFLLGQALTAGVRSALEWGWGAPARALSGTVAYLPALATLTLTALISLRLDRRASGVLALACAVFIVSLTARALDGPWCAHWPQGTHFLWHLLNAVVLYLNSRAQVMLVTRRSATPP